MYFSIFLACMKACNPFLGRIPLTDHDAYLDDVTNFVIKLANSNSKFSYNSNTTLLRIPYKQIVVYARK